MIDWKEGLEQAYHMRDKFRIYRVDDCIHIDGKDWLFPDYNGHYDPISNGFKKNWFLFLNLFRYYIFSNFSSDELDIEFKVVSIYEQFEKVFSHFHKLPSNPFITSVYEFYPIQIMGHSYIINLEQIVGKIIGIKKIVFNNYKYFLFKRLAVDKDEIPLEYYYLMSYWDDVRFFYGDINYFFRDRYAPAGSSILPQGNIKPDINTLDYTLIKCGSRFNRYGIGLSFPVNSFRFNMVVDSNFIKDDNLEIKQNENLKILYEYLENHYLDKLEKRKNLDKKFSYEIKEYFNGFDTSLGIVIKDDGYQIDEIIIDVDSLSDNLSKNFDNLEFEILYDGIYLVDK